MGTLNTLYMQKNGHSEPTHPYYAASTTKPLPGNDETWFKRNQVGINKPQSMMKRMVQGSDITPIFYKSTVSKLHSLSKLHKLDDLTECKFNTLIVKSQPRWWIPQYFCWSNSR